MSYNQFWKGKPELYWAYQVAYSNKLESDYEFENYKAWLNGLYFFDALSKANYNINRQNINDPVEMYMQKPIDFKELARLDKEEINKQKRIDNDNSIKNMLSSKKSLIERK